VIVPFMNVCPVQDECKTVHWSKSSECEDNSFKVFVTDHNWRLARKALKYRNGALAYLPGKHSDPRKANMVVERFTSRNLRCQNCKHGDVKRFSRRPFKMQEKQAWCWYALNVIVW